MIDPSPDVRSGRTLALKVALVASGAVLLLAVYWPALGGPFLLDDSANLTRAYLDRFSIEGLWQVATGNTSGILGRPVAAVSFALHFLLGEGTSFSFKLVNLVLHGCNAALVYRLCVEALPVLAVRHGSAYRSHAVSPHAIAIVVCLVWALHPLQVSTVMYVVQRMTILATGFSLLSLILYIRMRRAHTETGERRAHLVPLTVATTLLASFSKENGVLVLPSLLLVEWILFRFETRDPKERRTLVRAFHALLTLPTLLGVLYFVTHTDSLLSGYEWRDFGLRERVLTQASAVLAYLKMIVLPSLGDMTFYHDGFPVTRTLGFIALRDLSILASMAIAVPLCRSKAPVISFAIGLFLVSHLLESTVLPLELVFEHRNYAGSLGPALLIAWYGAALFRRLAVPRSAGVAAAALIALLSLQTFTRASHWESGSSLAAFAVEHGSRSSRARSALAMALATQGHYARAVEHLEVAATLDPHNAYDPLAIVQLNALASTFDKVALERAKAVLLDHPLTSDSASVLFTIHDAIKNGASASLGADHALTLFDTAVAGPEPRIDRWTEVVLHARHADLLEMAGRTDDATASLVKAMAMQPADVELRLRLAELLLRTDQPRKAAEALRTLHLGADESDQAAARLERLTRQLALAGIDFAEADDDVPSVLSVEH